MINLNLFVVCDKYILRQPKNGNRAINEQYQSHIPRRT